MKEPIDFHELLGNARAIGKATNTLRNDFREWMQVQDIGELSEKTGLSKQLLFTYRKETMDVKPSTILGILEQVARSRKGK